MWIENAGQSRWLAENSGATWFVQRQRPPFFWVSRLGWRHYSAVLEQEFQRQSVLFVVAHPQSRSDSTQVPRDDSHHLPKEVIQCGYRGQRIQASSKCLVRFCQLGGVLLRKQFPLACHGRSHFFCALQIADVHDRSHEFKAARLVF